MTQKGSLVGAERMRFDFSHFEGLTMATIRRVEELVNAQIRANHDVSTELMDLEAAKSAGAMALFGEKYEDDVRVVRMGITPPSCAAVLMPSAPATSASSRSSPRAASPQGCVVSKRSPAKVPSISCTSWASRSKRRQPW